MKRRKREIKKWGGKGGVPKNIGGGGVKTDLAYWETVYDRPYRKL